MTRSPTMTRPSLRRAAWAAATLLPLAAAPLAAQTVSRPDQAEFRWSGTIRSGTLARVSNISGDISITTTDGNRVELVATRRGTSGRSEARVEVKEHAGGVTICALYGEDSSCEAGGARHEGRGRRSGSDRGHYHLEVRIPRTVRVTAASVSGDVSVTGASGALRVTSVSGDVRLDRIRAADELVASTVSGDILARFDAVARGTELQLKSVSGDIELAAPGTVGFALSMSTVSGDLESDFPLTMEGRFNRRRVSARINDGGAPLRISTVSGDVRLRRLGE